MLRCYDITMSRYGGYLERMCKILDLVPVLPIRLVPFLDAGFRDCLE